MDTIPVPIDFSLRVPTFFKGGTGVVCNIKWNTNSSNLHLFNLRTYLYLHLYLQPSAQSAFHYIKQCFQRYVFAVVLNH